MTCIFVLLTCGFTKVLVHELFTSDFGVKQDGNKKIWQGNVNKKLFEKFQERYPDHCKNDTSSYKAFVNKFPNIIENIKSLGEKDPAGKKSFLSKFSTDSWTNLEQLKKTKYSPTDCQGCLKNAMYKNVLSKLPIKTNAYRRKAFLHDFNGKKSAVLHDVTNEIVSDLNCDFKSRFNFSFISQLTKLTKPNNIEKENTARAIKIDIEAKWKQTSVKT